MKKIMFNDKIGSTQAVLEGHKTMTRREESFLSKLTYTYGQQGMGTRIEVLPCGEVRHYRKDSDSFIVIGKSRFQVGEVVAVAQDYYTIEHSEVPSFLYLGGKEAGVFNKMFVKADLMPHQIRITGIKVERLQDINERDCRKEGVYKGQMIPPHSGATFRDEKDIYYPFRHIDPYNWHYDYKKAFAALINKVSGKGSWERNPWVVAYSFELIK